WGFRLMSLIPDPEVEYWANQLWLMIFDIRGRYRSTEAIAESSVEAVLEDHFADREHLRVGFAFVARAKLPCAVGCITRQGTGPVPPGRRVVRVGGRIRHAKIPGGEHTLVRPPDLETGHLRAELVTVVGGKVHHLARLEIGRVVRLLGNRVRTVLALEIGRRILGCDLVDRGVVIRSLLRPQRG